MPPSRRVCSAVCSVLDEALHLVPAARRRLELDAERRNRPGRLDLSRDARLHLHLLAGVRMLEREAHALADGRALAAAPRPARPSARDCGCGRRRPRPRLRCGRRRAPPPAAARRRPGLRRLVPAGAPQAITSGSSCRRISCTEPSNCTATPGVAPTCAISRGSRCTISPLTRSFCLQNASTISTRTASRSSNACVVAMKTPPLTRFCRYSRWNAAASENEIRSTRIDLATAASGRGAVTPPRSGIGRPGFRLNPRPRGPLGALLPTRSGARPEPGAARAAGWRGPGAGRRLRRVQGQAGVDPTRLRLGQGRAGGPMRILLINPSYPFEEFPRLLVTLPYVASALRARGARGRDPRPAARAHHAREDRAPHAALPARSWSGITSVTLNHHIANSIARGGAQVRRARCRS